jgi:hypothetical protein
MSMAVPDMTPARHGDATFRTDLSPLPTHARRDFRLVWNEIGTKPHRIGRAGLADIDTLGTGFIQTAEQCADRQRQPADKMYCSHSFLPGLKKLFRAEMRVGCASGRWQAS